MAKHDIRSSLLFEGVNKEDVDRFLSDFSETAALKKGEFLWKEGEPGDSMYLLESGKLDVVAEENIVLATLESGAVIGEVCVFGQKKRSAGIRAAEDSKLLLINGDLFRRQIKRGDVGVLLMSYNIAKLLSQRLVTAGEFIRKMQKVAEKGGVQSELQHYRQRFFEESLFN